MAGVLGGLELIIVSEPPDKFYNQQGGKYDCFVVKVGLRGSSSHEALYMREGLPLEVRLLYENQKVVENQAILQLMNPPQINLKTRTGELRVRINEVSKNHQSQVRTACSVCGWSSLVIHEEHGWVLACSAFGCASASDESSLAPTSARFRQCAVPCPPQSKCCQSVPDVAALLPVVCRLLLFFLPSLKQSSLFLLAAESGGDRLKTRVRLPRGTM